MSIEDEARAEAERRWPAEPHLAPNAETSYPRYALRQMMQGAFETGYITGASRQPSEAEVEPTDAQVDAALTRFGERRDETWRDAMRAALIVAARTARGEQHG